MYATSKLGGSRRSSPGGFKNTTSVKGSVVLGFGNECETPAEWEMMKLTYLVEAMHAKYVTKVYRV